MISRELFGELVIFFLLQADSPKIKKKKGLSCTEYNVTKIRPMCLPLATLKIDYYNVVFGSERSTLIRNNKLACI